MDSELLPFKLQLHTCRPYVVKIQEKFEIWENLRSGGSRQLENVFPYFKDVVLEKVQSI